MATPQTASTSTKKWVTKLQKLNGAVTERRNPFKTVLRTSSPSVNYIFGKTHGLPLGYTAVLYGPPKGGKTVISSLLIGDLHSNDPDAIAIKFDSEFRTNAQLTDEDLGKFGIDSERLMVFETNSPGDVFNQISTQIQALCQEGMPLKLIVIDSISSIQGRRDLENSDVEKFTIGDHAQTIQIGLKQILPVIRKYNVALVIIAQARSEMDQNKAKYEGPYKMQGSFGLQHMAEYFILVEPFNTKAGKVDAFGNEFVDKSMTDMSERGDRFAKKIKVQMKDSSLGPSGRTGAFTFDFNTGVINQWEEIGRLAINRKLVDNPSQGWYSYGEEKWHGEKAFFKAVQESADLQRDFVQELLRRDSENLIPEEETSDV